jgi:hypothetical protein
MSGKRLRRGAKLDTYVTKEVPHARIIGDTLWQRVQLRLKQEVAPLKLSPEGEVSAFWDRRRPARTILSAGLPHAVAATIAGPFGDKLWRPMCSTSWSGNSCSRLLVAEFVSAFSDEPARQVAEQNSQATNRQRPCRFGLQDCSSGACHR